VYTVVYACIRPCAGRVHVNSTVYTAVHGPYTAVCTAEYTAVYTAVYMACVHIWRVHGV